MIQLVNVYQGKDIRVPAWLVSRQIIEWGCAVVFNKSMNQFTRTLITTANYVNIFVISNKTCEFV